MNSILNFLPNFWISSTTDKTSWNLIINDEQNSVVTLFSAKASAGYPNKYSNNRKIESDDGDNGRWEKACASLALPIVPRTLSFFPLPSLTTTHRGLQLRRREVLWRLNYNVGTEGIRGIARIFQRGRGACHTVPHPGYLPDWLVTSMLHFT